MKDERKAIQTTSSPYKLGVRFYNSNENTQEVDFVLQHIEVVKEGNKDHPISRAEEGRR